ncbi:aryl alcohol oxidase [Mycena leptocephala]|nr:aryl alcohol oxidase [Mycena leptocephala]
MAWISSLLVLALGIQLCTGIILDDIVDLERLKLKFDFIIVGGGTAGSVIANRLSENPNYSILVLEAGGSNADVLNVMVPFFCPRATPNTPQDWNYTTTPQVALNNVFIAYTRGFGLGGSSSVNYMVYARGSKEDYDRWAKVTRDDGWSWDNLVQYMRKNERFSPPADHHNTTGQFNPAVHGFRGINSYPFNLDTNSGYPLGIGWVQATIKNGARSSSATSYLTPQFATRHNLHVLLHARVTRVLPTTSSTFRTVEFVQDLNGKRFTLTAGRELILSAGSIGTPNILLHSGIGNSSTLTSLGIKSLHNLPSVGQNFSDHPLTFLSFLVTADVSTEGANQKITVLGIF